MLADRRSSAAVANRTPLPEPDRAAPPLQPEADLGLAGVTPFVTPNDRFYRVDTALEIPVLAAVDWRLRVHGMVDRELELTCDELLELPIVERDITLTCVSNQVGGSYVGNARWIGVPLATVLERAGSSPAPTRSCRARSTA